MSVTINNPVASSIVRRDSDVSIELEKSELHPLLQKIYANRGITRAEQVKYNLSQLLDFSLLKDIDVASSLVTTMIQQKKNILVIGDFDADGATSCAVVLRALKLFGHHQVDYLVPNRFDFGYGLSPQIVDVAGNLPQKPDLIVTVDNGISSIDGVERANALGIPVVVTDHHLAANVLPDAAAIVNPNQPECTFPEKTIAGVGVAFYLMLAVRASLRQHNWFSSESDANGVAEPNMATLLDLVALGTVADVVPLDNNNRILVNYGLQRIRAHKACAGINALLSVAGKSIDACASQDFGFIIGPRLNAAGRLDDISVGIECLLTDNTDTAAEYAAQLNAMNIQRRQIEGEMLEQANVILDSRLSQFEQHDVPAAIAMFDEQWHQGVVGLLASRIKEKLHRPVITFAQADNGEIKGSGRSIPGLHMRDILDLIAKNNQGLIIKFGGHAMAAGLTVKEKDFPLFQKSFETEVANALTEEDLKQMNYTDGSISANDLTIETSELFRYASPWGQLFPEPVFDDVFTVANWRIVGQKHLKLELKKDDSNNVYAAIAFNMTDENLPSGSDKIRAVYRLDVNEFRGRRDLQLIIQHIESV